MNRKKFIIDLDSDSEFVRPKISYKVKEYAETFFVKYFTNKKIIVNNNLDTRIHICFYNSNRNYIEVLPFKTIKSDNVKLTSIMISYLDRMENSKDKNVEFMYIIFDVISEFLMKNYKKIKSDELKKLKKGIDVKYLQSIKYPVSFDEEKFLTDGVKTTVHFLKTNTP